MTGLVSTISERPADTICACAIGGLPVEIGDIADALGLLPEQFGATRGGAIQADIDLPSGFWRVWPDSGIGLWVGRDPGQAPPLQRWHPAVELDLLETVLRLGEHDAWLYEGKLHADDGWTEPMSLKSIYALLHVHGELFDAMTGVFDDAGRAQHATITRSGCVEMSSPAQAVRWLSIAYGLNSD